jgi:SpoVK/Ycf46/Vps4 family AAA+-type ATPase
VSNKEKKIEPNVEEFLMDLGNLSLDEIVGQDDAISELKKFVESIKYKIIYKSWSLKSPRGLLLTGEPGVGKTAAIRALAKELENDVILMELRYLDIASKWIDAPIEQLRQFFGVAEKRSAEKHVIIFIDELEAMIPDRNNQLHETSMKRVNVFLEWMDGGFSSIDNITIIGATNFLEGVDKAARRPGRFDKIIHFVDLNSSAVVKGLKIHLSKRDIGDKLDNINWNDIETAVGDSKFSGADLPEIINRLIDTKVTEHIDMINQTYDFRALSRIEQRGILTQNKLLPEKINTSYFIETIRKYATYKRNTAKSTSRKLGFDTASC